MAEQGPAIVERVSQSEATEGELRALVATPYEQLLRVAGLVCREHADAEDAVAAALERAWRSRTALDDPAHAAAWLRRIVIREALRAEGRRRRLLGRWIAEPSAFALTDDPDQAREIALREALRALPPAQRAAIVLHLYAGYSVQETAELLGVPLETLRSRLRLARARLREALADRR
ncbi:MAG: RNA polymerase sigma factor [Candidatus Limnocylindrales bacterium]